MVWIVEKWNPHAHVRQDVFGFGDLLASKPGEPAMLVQTCAGATHAAHKTKILDEPRALQWVSDGHGILLISWSKKKLREDVRSWLKGWMPRVERIQLDDFADRRSLPL